MKKILFKSDGTAFSALYKCQKYLDENEYSYGSLQRRDPSGVKKGNHEIPKWRYIDESSISMLDGYFAGDPREGDISLLLFDDDTELFNKNFDKEVEGCWSTDGQECPCCGNTLEIVPWRGHINSKYWIKAQGDFLYLYACPNGCPVESANKKRKKFSFFIGYTKEGSTPFKYEIDFKKFKNAWIDWDGKCYPVEPKGHSSFPRRMFQEDERFLENKKWAKITQVNWHAISMNDRGFSKKQKDTLFDFCMAHNLETEGLFYDFVNLFEFKPIARSLPHDHKRD